MSFICKSYPTRRVCNAELALFIVRSRGLHTLQRGQRVGAPGHAASLFHDVWRQELTLHRRHPPKNLESGREAGDHRCTRRGASWRPTPSSASSVAKRQGPSLQGARQSFRVSRGGPPTKAKGRGVVCRSRVYAVRYAGCIKFGGLRLDEP